MEVVWVFDNIKNHKSFYSRYNVLMFIASVSLWRKYHPDHKTVLYIDDMSKKLLEDLEVISLWHSIRELEYPEKINKQIFWSGCKTKIISETKIPILLIDHDFLIFRNVDEYLKDDILCTYDEFAINWYPSSGDVYNKNLTTPIEHIVNRASNVSLFYLPDPKFANRYGKQTLTNHEEFTAMEVIGMTANHMIYSEQFMLRQWIEKENIPYKTLCKNIWDCKVTTYTATEWENGYWSREQANRSYRHYGVDKRKVLENKPGFEYKDTISYLFRCINAAKLTDVNKLKTNIEKIERK